MLGVASVLKDWSLPDVALSGDLGLIDVGASF